MAETTSSQVALSMAFVRGLVEAVEAFGVTRDELLRGSGIAVDELADPQSSVLRGQVDALVVRAVQLTGEPALGLHWWERATFGAFGAVAHALSVARSFRAGIQLMERYWPLFLSRPLLDVHDDGVHCRIVLNAAASEPIAHRAYMEAGAFALCRFLRQCVGVAGLPVQVSFDYPEPAYRMAYDSHLRCPLLFGAANTALTVLSVHMDHPHLNHAPELDAQLRTYADALLAAQQPLQLASRVLGVLRAVPDAQRSSMEDVASRLGMSERTLRRHLQNEGSSFPLLAQQVLREHAEAMLKDPSRSVKQVAYALGFADTSAFHRAVRRWTGKTPSDLRSQATAKVPLLRPVQMSRQPGKTRPSTGR